MPPELPEDISQDPEKKWRYRKPTDDNKISQAPRMEELVEEPLGDSTAVEHSGESMQETKEVQVEEPQELLVGATEENEVALLQAEVENLTTEIKQARQENSNLSTRVETLKSQIKELTQHVAILNEQLEEANKKKTTLAEQTAQLEEEVKILTENKKELTKQLKKNKSQLLESEKQISKLEQNLEQHKTTAKDREDQLMSQLEALAEQIGKLRGVVKKRDEELIALQKDILVKKDMAEDAQEEADHLRTVGIVQREAVQDTTVLRRRLTDLEVEMDQLKRALEKDSKYRIYLLVRETGQRTLEELSKVLGVGVFEAQRRVQELVRAGLLELKDEKVKVSRRK
ncbi:MAG: hypothetical protein ACFFD8_00595 [Candidatus Thorarchaeota archaeon]